MLHGLVRGHGFRRGLMPESSTKPLKQSAKIPEVAMLLCGRWLIFLSMLGFRIKGALQIRGRILGSQIVAIMLTTPTARFYVGLPPKKGHSMHEFTSTRGLGNPASTQQSRNINPKL